MEKVQSTNHRPDITDRFTEWLKLNQGLLRAYLNKEFKLIVEPDFAYLSNNRVNMKFLDLDKPCPVPDEFMSEFEDIYDCFILSVLAEIRYDLSKVWSSYVGQVFNKDILDSMKTDVLRIIMEYDNRENIKLSDRFIDYIGI